MLRHVKLLHTTTKRLTNGAAAATNLVLREMDGATTNTTSSSRYEEAVNLLNTLQSNAQYIKNAAAANVGNVVVNNNNSKSQREKFNEIENYLSRLNISLDKLDELQVIHVAGTKGKGSTCAFCERILRHHGFKTGFYSSPHLLEVRERIRINGKPIDKNDFASYCFKTYETLDAKKTSDTDMPTYFRFLTLMAFKYFLEVKVDVAIIEVGIGGEYDCTNMLRKVPVVGITSLGIDHTVLLGDTIDSIAWHKGGIMKKGSNAYTVEQPAEAMKVLEERSEEKQSTLEVVKTDLSAFDYLRSKVVPFEILATNASLALALSKAWITQRKANEFSMSIARKALEKCVWPGRYEIRRINNVTYYLDGAHTMESITICCDWFKKMSEKSPNKKVLMFNLKGQRDTVKFLKKLKELRFDVVLFVPNVSGLDTTTGDNLLFTDAQLKKCEEHKRLWTSLNEVTENNNEAPQKVEIYSSVSEGIASLKYSQDYDLLATGSLHLVGALLEILDPNLNDNFSTTADQ